MKQLILFILFPFYMLSQEKSTLRIEFGADYRNFQMSEFNRQINDTAFIQSDFYEDISLPRGNHFGMTVSYQPFQFISFGIYGGYQFSATSRNFEFTFDQGNNPEPYEPISGVINYEVQSISGGLSTQLLLHQMNFWPKHPVFSRIESVFSVQAGFGRATFLSNQVVDDEDVIPSPLKSFYQSQGIQLISSLKMGCILTKNHYFSSLGLTLGYQSFITSNLKTDNGSSYPHDGETKLDFSGLSLGVYLSFGR